MLTTAVEFSAPRRVETIQIDIDPPMPGEALVRSVYSGISGGTETLAYRGEIDPQLALDEALGGYSGDFSFPFRYGYSVVGRVAESRCELDEGTLVFCFHPHQADVVRPCSELIPLEGIEPRMATMFPLVETALQISLEAGAVAGETVVVLGLGPVGTITAALLQRSGADVIAGDPRPDRRETAQWFGIRACDPADLPRRVSEIRKGRDAALVVEVSGDPQALRAALGLLGHEGTVLVASWYGSKEVSLPLGGAFHRRRLTLRSSQVSTIPSHLAARWDLTRRRQRTIELMDELPLKKLATHEFAVQDAQRAFDAVDAGLPGLMHAALRYTED